MTKEQFESWLSSLPADEQEQAKNFFTVIRWKSKPAKGKGAERSPEQIRDQLQAVPYSQEYKSDLTRAADLLREAAGLTDNPSLKKFLTLRADAFLSNDYYESDLAWMDLDAPLDITIGPYETYNDELFGYKAAFEAYVNLRDDQETAKLGAFTQHLQDIENNLPIDPQYRNPKLGAAAPIRVVDEIFAAGDGAHGVQTAAYNLPNDERVVQQKGSKRVMLKNVQEAKFRSTLLPIARRELQFIFHAYSGERVNAWPRASSDPGATAQYDGAGRVERTVQRNRRSQGGRHRTFCPAVHDGPRERDGARKRAAGGWSR